MTSLTNNKGDNLQSLIAALRSGKYVQGEKGYLRSSTGYCCQGVGCDLVNPEGWSGPSRHQAFSLAPNGGYSLYLWDAIGWQYFGISSDDSDLLAYMNDGSRGFDERHTFEEIADAMEFLYLAGLTDRGPVS